MTYPKDTEGNLRLRAELLQCAENDKQLQSALIEMCRKDRLYWFNLFVWTYDPRTADKHLPFITYPFQDEFILWDAEFPKIQDKITGKLGEDNLVMKSKDMGASWMLAMNDLYDWIFSEDRIEVRWGSRKEQYVDTRGDMDSTFEKFRYALKMMPDWMRPAGFSFSEHDMTMRLINPVTQSCITGEATNENFGRGGRKYRIRFDEFAFWESDSAAWQSSSDATNCRTAFSTPHGSGNKFAELAWDSGSKIKKATLHWTLHPVKCAGAYYLDGEGKQIPIPDCAAAFALWDKNRQNGLVVRSPWYDAEAERRNAQDIAQELDIDPLMSGSPFFSVPAVRKQRIWTKMIRRNPFSPMIGGRFIQGKIIYLNNKYEFKENQFDAWVNIYELPQSYLEYVLGGDTSEGLAKGDESFGVIRDKYTRNTVATVNGLFSPDVFEEYCWLAAKFYNDALSGIENAVFGYAVNKGLENRGANLYYENSGKNSATARRGFTTDAKSRPLILAKGEEEIRKGASEVRDPKILSQMLTFIRNPDKGGRPEADGSMKDDGVIAWLISGFMIDEHPYKPRKVSTSASRETPRSQRNAGFGF